MNEWINDALYSAFDVNVILVSISCGINMWGGVGVGVLIAGYPPPPPPLETTFLIIAVMQLLLLLVCSRAVQRPLEGQVLKI